LTITLIQRSCFAEATGWLGSFSVIEQISFRRNRKSSVRSNIDYDTGTGFKLIGRCSSGSVSIRTRKFRGGPGKIRNAATSSTGMDPRVAQAARPEQLELRQTRNAACLAGIGFPAGVAALRETRGAARERRQCAIRRRRHLA